jgi:hypothetical protein
VNSTPGFGVSFCCAFVWLSVFIQGALGFCMALFLAASRCLNRRLGGLLEALLRTAMGTKKWPPYRFDSLCFGLSEALWGALVGSRAVSSPFFVVLF